MGIAISTLFFGLALGDTGACDTPTALKRRVQKYPIFELSLANALGRVPL